MKIINKSNRATARINIYIMNRRDFFNKSIFSTASMLLVSPVSVRRILGATDNNEELIKQVGNVNSTDIEDAIRLGCRTMQNVFNADDNYFPFFRSFVWPDPRLVFDQHHNESHVPGRHLNALLNAEDTIGLKLDEKAVEHHRKAAFFSFSGPLPLPLNRNEVNGPLVNFCPHDLREGFHALYSLVKYRKDEGAREVAEKSIDAILNFWDPVHRWDKKRIAELGINYRNNGFFINREARMIGSLVKYYRATGYGPALELALILKEKAITEVFTTDGSYDLQRFETRHSHSITCVMSSLAQLADLLKDSVLMNRVKAFYDNGLLNMRDEIGWSPEAVFQEGLDNGESNNSGDILETALLLGQWGYTEYYHDAERIIRCHLLPSQLRDVSFIVDPPNPNGIDGLRDVADRHLGAWGFPAPYGHKSIGKGRGYLSFNMDIVGGVVGSLCEACRETVKTTNTGTWVNMLFDYETSEAKVESPYTHDCLSIELKRSGPLFVRIPSWLDVSEVKVKGIGIKPVFSNGYMYFDQVLANHPIQLYFPLKETTIILSGNVHMHPIRVKMKGDSVLAMDNFGARLTFFDPFQ